MKGFVVVVPLRENERDITEKQLEFIESFEERMWFEHRVTVDISELDAEDLGTKQARSVIDQLKSIEADIENDGPEVVSVKKAVSVWDKAEFGITLFFAGGAFIALAAAFFGGEEDMPGMIAMGAVALMPAFLMLRSWMRLIR